MQHDYTDLTRADIVTIRRSFLRENEANLEGARFAERVHRTVARQAKDRRVAAESTAEANKARDRVVGLEHALQAIRAALKEAEDALAAEEGRQESDAGAAPSPNGAAETGDLERVG